MIREGGQEELREAATFLDVEIVLHGRIAPVGQGGRRVVGRVEAISSDESDGIAENGPGEGEWRTDADTGVLPPC